jgi:hypothetical protein
MYLNAFNKRDFLRTFPQHALPNCVQMLVHGSNSGRRFGEFGAGAPSGFFLQTRRKDERGHGDAKGFHGGAIVMQSPASTLGGGGFWCGSSALSVCRVRHRLEADASG